MSSRDTSDSEAICRSSVGLALDRGLSDLVSILVQMETAFEVTQDDSENLRQVRQASLQNVDLARQVAEDLHSLARINVMLDNNPRAITNQETGELLRLERSRRYLAVQSGASGKCPPNRAGETDWL